MQKQNPQQYDFSQFVSLSHERMSFDDVARALFSYIREVADRDYRITIGTDSEGYGAVSYATALVVHRVGSGGRGFVCKNKVTTKTLRDKIYNETLISLAFAQDIVPVLIDRLGEKFVRDNLIIHVDVGAAGETKDMIREVTGMVRGFGFQVVTKPESYAASSVADRFAVPTKSAA